MTLGLKHFTERIGDGIGQPRLDFDGGEELMHVQNGVAIVLGRRLPESPGTLYISTRRVIWLSDTVRDKGYAVDFLSVSLHAVSRDPEAYPSPCIYTQIEVEAAEDDDSEGLDDECPDETDISKITEMRLVPYDPNQYFVQGATTPAVAFGLCSVCACCEVLFINTKNLLPVLCCAQSCALAAAAPPPPK